MKKGNARVKTVTQRPEGSESTKKKRIQGYKTGDDRRKVDNYAIAYL